MRRGLIPCGILTLLCLAAPALPQGRQADARRTPVVVVAERVSPAVVNISAESTVRRVDPFFGGLFGPSRRSQSLGSGLIVAANGIVVTNAHVVEGASRILVTMLDGRELEADLLGSDRDADLAVLKVAASNLPAVPLGRSSDLMIGETVVAIGNPFGLSHTVTTGVLSAMGRSVPSEASEGSEDGGQVFTDFLQIDASINPGNSGGPLVNLAGEVIGLNTAIIQGANGIGFAIPADRARRVVDELLRFGELRPLWTGARLVTVDPEMARRAGLPVPRGAAVLKIYPDSPAAAAGLREQDVIIGVNGRPAGSREEVSTALYTVEAGTPVRLDVRRGEQTLQLTLRAVQPPERLGIELLREGVGLVTEEGKNGLVVQRVIAGSEAAERGLRPGDVVLGANGQRARTHAELSREVLRGIERGGLLLAVQRGRYVYNIGFPL